MDTEKKAMLINNLIKEGFLRSPAIINAFRKVPRENFVPSDLRKYAYVDEPLPIGEGQTISQPLTVAAMTEALDAKPGQHVLEVGTGSGYQVAILSHIVGHRGSIVTTERIWSLFETAKKNLSGYGNVTVINCDGSEGYEKEAPYDRIIVTASSPSVPKPLAGQLKDGGRMVIPVGNEMLLIEKLHGKIKKTFLGYYVFVPLLGKHGYGH